MTNPHQSKDELEPHEVIYEALKLYANAHNLAKLDDSGESAVVLIAQFRRLAADKLRTLITQREQAAYQRGRRDVLSEVRTQANGSYEIRMPKEPENMVWEIAEWQLKELELKEQQK